MFEPKNNLIIAIEAKFLSDWNIEKDVKHNYDRIKLFKDKNKIQCLLVTKQKLKNSKKAGQTKTNYKELLRYETNLEFPLVFLTWEGLIQECEHQKIKDYFMKHIEENECRKRNKS